MVELVRVPGISSIRESNEKLFGRVSEMVESFCEYQKTVEFVRLSRIGRIRESTKKHSR